MPRGKKTKRGAPRSVEEMFYAGRYGRIVREHVDAGSARAAFADLPFLIGALAFVGRLEEARALFSSGMRRRAAGHDQSPIVAARFFLGVAYCRAGRISEGTREFVANLRARRGSSLSRFYVFQGLGCLRYFTGRLRQSARQALCALEHAFVADFAYGRLLATDLRGHALVQLGEIQNGLSLLGTARTLAGSLGLSGNVAALDCAIGMYRARFGVVPVRDAILELQNLLAQARPEDSYSERSLRIELAVQAALAGEGDTAWGLLERLGIEHVPDGGDARVKIRFLVACANVARLRYGAASMQPFVSEARALLRDRHDTALELDVSCMELISAADPAEAAEIRARLLALHRRSGIGRVWLRASGARRSNAPGASELPDSERACADWHHESESCGFALAPGVEALAEDRLGALYIACLRASPELASRLIHSGHWGLLPLALGLTPGTRLLVFGRSLVLEDHGNVTVLSDPPEGTLRLLRALAGQRLRSKEELLALVWGIANYRPDAHDAVIHTAVSRVRAQLGVRGHWIEAAAGGYRLARGVELLNAFESSGSADAPERTSLEMDEVGVREHPDAVLQALACAGPASSSDIAAKLGVSEMTALRRLRQHVEQGLVSRDGKGKNTRYRLLGVAS